MIAKDENADRDNVLLAFHQQCEKPTAEDIISWVQRYPQFAEDLRIHAAIARDWSATKENDLEVPEEMFNKAYSLGLSAIYSAEINGVSNSSEVQQSFESIIASKNKTIPQLAREIDISRSVIADLFGGRIRPPISRRFTEALMRSLSISTEKLSDLVQYSIRNPSIGMAKASSITSVVSREFADVIKSSGMTSEKIKYWLDEE